MRYSGRSGGGKTTLVKAILWCLYGEVEASVTMDAKVITRKRPLTDQKQHEGKKTWCLPLLNDKAYLEGNYEVQVSIDFEHEGSKYSLLRAGNSKSNKPRDDRDMNVEVHLQKGKKSIPAGRIDSTIEEIMPEKISILLRRGRCNKQLLGIAVQRRNRRLNRRGSRGHPGFTCLGRFRRGFHHARRFSGQSGVEGEEEANEQLPRLEKTRQDRIGTSRDGSGSAELPTAGRPLELQNRRNRHRAPVRRHP